MKMKALNGVLVCVVVLMCALSVCQSQTNPGIKAFVGQSGLNYIVAVGIPILEQELQTINVPDITGKVGTPVGTIEYDLTDIVISGLFIPSASLVTTSVGLAASVSGASASAHLNWHYREEAWPHVSDSGDADIDISDTSISLSLAVTEANGLPVLSVASDSVNIGNMDIHLHGGASWLYQIFVDIFEPEIKSAGEGAMQSAISSVITSTVNKLLASLPVTLPVTNNVEIDYAMVQNPVFVSGSYFETYLTGAFYEISNPTPPPFQAPDMPDTPPTQMI